MTAPSTPACKSDSNAVSVGCDALFGFVGFEPVSLADANRTCRTDSATLEGCAPFPGRAIVVDGADTCRVVVHEGAHWLDAGCAHDAPCWPVEAEITGKALCDSP